LWIEISQGISAGPSGARPPEHLSATRLRYAPLAWARPRPARGGDTRRAPRSQGWSGAALLVLGLDTRRRRAEDLGNGLGTDVFPNYLNNKKLRALIFK